MTNRKLARVLYVLSVLAAVMATIYAGDGNIERHSIAGASSWAVDSPKGGGAVAFGVISGFLALSGTLASVLGREQSS